MPFALTRFIPGPMVSVGCPTRMARRGPSCGSTAIVARAFGSTGWDNRTAPLFPVMTTDSEMPSDPICGMKVSPDTPFRAERGGQTYFFCCARCRDRFRGGREALPPTARPPVSETAAGAYLCPMHPEVRQDRPGDCPLCGMALEAAAAAEGPGGGENAERRDLTRRLTVAAVLTLPVFALAMAHMIPGLGRQTWAHGAVSRWLQFVLSAPVVGWAGWPFFRRAWRSIATRRPNMFTLISLGVGASFLFSTAALLMPQRFPSVAQHAGRIGIYFEAAAVIVVLALLGQVLELRARLRTGSSIRALMNLAPPTARCVAPANEAPRRCSSPASRPSTASLRLTSCCGPWSDRRC